MKRKEPASVVVEFFETASVETAQTVLAICKGVVARRSPTKARESKARTAKVAARNPSGRDAMTESETANRAN